ncbi:DUF397 domain-containing protein [Actinomadura graeca]|uniref:DUF397 domain-containing protein n=1 Tax=Actinomadura graeca TaxID=2750812 RepID=A0ABX8QYS7_9ACTN|nr:DUF397 domain-containing protein [Actinomadura graeca]QXJ23984.1 DUF397 domain-containing protein [Actinomadura graeca]
MDLSKAVWRKASRSTVQNDNCVELAAIASVVVFRDSKDPNGLKIPISRNAFLDLTDTLKDL